MTATPFLETAEATEETAEASNATEAFDATDVADEPEGSGVCAFPAENYVIAVDLGHLADDDDSGDGTDDGDDSGNSGVDGSDADNAPLTGSALLAKLRKLPSTASKTEMAQACGYVGFKKDGGTTTRLKAFYEAWLAAKGITLETPVKKSTGRQPSFGVKVQPNGAILINPSYTKMALITPGERMEIRVNKGRIQLIQLIQQESTASE